MFVQTRIQTPHRLANAQQPNPNPNPTPPEDPPQDPTDGFFDGFRSDKVKMGLAGALVGGATALIGNQTNAQTGMIAGLALGGGAGAMAGENLSDRIGGAILGAGLDHAVGIIGAHAGTVPAVIFGAGMGAATAVIVSMYHAQKGAEG